MNAAELMQRIQVDTGLHRILRVAESREDADPGHDLPHSLRVALWTLRLGEGTINPREAIAAALLHDAINLPKDSPQRSSASLLSAQLASEVLERSTRFTLRNTMRSFVVKTAKATC